jgi:hypothetical protein
MTTSIPIGPTPPSKPWWQSKTVWLSVLSTLAGIGTYVGLIPGPVGAVALGISGVAGVILRAVTNQAITLTTTPSTSTTPQPG